MTSSDSNPYAAPTADAGIRLRRFAATVRFTPVWRTVCVSLVAVSAFRLVLALMGVGAEVFGLVRGLGDPGVRYSERDWLLYETILMWVDALSIPLGLCDLVLLIMWCYQTHLNIRLMGYQPFWGRAATIWVFLIPIVHVVIMPWVVCDLMRGVRQDRSWPLVGLVIVWWALGVLTWVAVLAPIIVFDDLDLGMSVMALGFHGGMAALLLVQIVWVVWGSRLQRAAAAVSTEERAQARRAARARQSSGGEG